MNLCCLVLSVMTIAFGFLSAASWQQLGRIRADNRDAMKANRFLVEELRRSGFNDTHKRSSPAIVVDLCPDYRAGVGCATHPWWMVRLFESIGMASLFCFARSYHACTKMREFEV